MNGTPQNHGTVLAVRGSVIDVRFDHGLPPINNLLRAGDQGRVMIEVWAQFPGGLSGIAFNLDEGEIGVVLLGDYGSSIRLVDHSMTQARSIAPSACPLSANQKQSWTAPRLRYRCRPESRSSMPWSRSGADNEN